MVGPRSIPVEFTYLCWGSVLFLLLEQEFLEKERLTVTSTSSTPKGRRWLLLPEPQGLPFPCPFSRPRTTSTDLSLIVLSGDRGQAWPPKPGSRDPQTLSMRTLQNNKKKINSFGLCHPNQIKPMLLSTTHAFTLVFLKFYNPCPSDTQFQQLYWHIRDIQPTVCTESLNVESR